LFFFVVVETKMKSIFGVALVLLLTAVVSVYAAASCSLKNVNGVKKLICTGNGEITATNTQYFKDQAKELVFQHGEINISGETFKDFSVLEKVTFGDGASIPRINVGAFTNCRRLSSMDPLPASLRALGGHPFENCTSLEAINVDSKNPEFESIEGVLFQKYKDSLHPLYLIEYPPGKKGEYTIPSEAKGIDTWAFLRAEYLESVIIPQMPSGDFGFEGIHQEAFYHNKNLKSVKYLGTKDPRKGASFPIFKDCPKVTKVCVPDNYQDEKFCLIDASSECKSNSGKCGDTVQWSLDENGVLTATGTGTMDTCDISDEQKAEVKSVKIDNGITKIDEWALSRYPMTTVSIPNSVQEIGDNAFYECKKLNSVTVPASCSKVGDFAFLGCEELASASFLSTSMTTISREVFYHCHKLNSFVIPTSVTTIEQNAFRGCDLSTITIPASVTSVGGFAFEFNENLETVFYMGSTDPNGQSVFINCPKLEKVCVPSTYTDSTFCELPAVDCSAPNPSSSHAPNSSSSPAPSPSPSPAPSPNPPNQSSQTLPSSSVIVCPTIGLMTFIALVVLLF